jgi:tRNA threonylcarbamoyladenosine biosynthesis protein TsaE|tara:strand:+ start:197 stop:676 length:480 start_codon:yes stop_codon:yes gene_type:complete
MLTATKGGKINISEEKDTKSVAEKFSKLIKQGDFILLSGNLGVGKTTFIKHLINSLQKANKQKISEVTSPTFNITNEYQIKKTLIKHYDLYRIKNKKELYNLGIQENLNDQITLVEWPKIIKKIKVKNSINLIFEYKKNYTERYLSIISKNKKFLNEFK